MGLKFGGDNSFLGGGPITHVRHLFLSAAVLRASAGAVLGYFQVMINAHWTNPFNETGLTDSSGLRLYYTETLRPCVPSAHASYL